MVEHGYKPSAVNRDLSAMGSAYRWAKAKRLCPKGSIVDFEGIVPDGWNRYGCLLRLGVAIEQEELPAGANPRAFVKSRNLHRRHLNASQRALAVVAVNEWAPIAANQHSKVGVAPGGTPLTNEQLAAEADASPSAIRHAKVVAGQATPEVVEALKAGEMSLTRVVETIKPMAPSQIPMSIQRLALKDQLVLLAAHPCSGAVGASKGDLNTGTRNLTLDEPTLLDGECLQAFPSMTGDRNTQWSTQ
jgi:hypothetical protein